MYRLARALFLILIFGQANPVIGLAETPAPVLKGSAVVSGDTIRLGDLFENMGGKAETPIAYAPRPGERVTLDSRWLASVAAAHKVSWRPTPYDRIIVERASIQIHRDMIEAEILAALAKYDLGPDAEIELTAREIQLYVPAEDSISVAVLDVRYDERTQRFQALVEAPAGSPEATQLRLTGRAFRVAEVPVVTRNLNRGEVITAEDLDWVTLRDDKLRRGILTDPEELIGMEVRSLLRAGYPVRSADLRRPVLVTKGSMVRMVLIQNGMSLTTQGRAIENGGKGDVIRVTNSASNITVEATVEGPNLVSVLPAGISLAN